MLYIPIMCIYIYIYIYVCLRKAAGDLARRRPQEAGSKIQLAGVRLMELGRITNTNTHTHYVKTTRANTIRNKSYGELTTISPVSKSSLMDFVFSSICLQLYVQTIF